MIRLRRWPLWLLAVVLVGGPGVVVAALGLGISAVLGRGSGGPGLGAAAAVCAVTLTTAALGAAALAVVTTGAIRSLGRPEDGVRRPGIRRPSIREVQAAAGRIAVVQAQARIAREVAERQRQAAEEAGAGVSRLLAGLIDAEEGTRGQLSAELHDTVAQSLLTARLLLLDGDHAGAGTHVTEAEEQVRGLMARTRPPELREGNLAQAVVTLRDDLEHRYGLQVTLTWPQRPAPLPLATAVVLYRFFQEALLNVVKHADGDRASAGLDIVEGSVLARVSDTGPGFDLAAVTSTGGRHVGLALMRERARLAGGAVTVESAPGEGTTVWLRMPVPRPPEHLAPAAEPVHSWGAGLSDAGAPGR